MVKIYRKQRIEGVTVPGIIHNSSYFLVNLGIYEDGTVSCWDKCDLDKFRDKLKKGWVVPAVPDGKLLCVSFLGHYKVEHGQWNYEIDGFNQYVGNVVKSINPEMANIYSTTEREQEKWNKARVKFTSSPIPFKIKSELGYDTLDGRNNFIFYRDDNGKLSLTAYTVYGDKTVKIDASGDNFYSLEEIEELFDNKTLLTSVNKCEDVFIEGLGVVTLSTEEGQSVKVSDKIKEIKDDAADLAGDKDSLERCREAYFYYLTDPTEWARENLRKLYEEVPEHQRCFLGDMDTRDSDYVRILYHPEDKREV